MAKAPSPAPVVQRAKQPHKKQAHSSDKPEQRTRRPVGKKRAKPEVPGSRRVRGRKYSGGHSEQPAPGFLNRLRRTSLSGGPWAIVEAGAHHLLFIAGLDRHASPLFPGSIVLGLTLTAMGLSRVVRLGPTAPRVQIGVLRASTTDALLLSQLVLSEIISAANVLAPGWRVAVLFAALAGVAALLSIEPRAAGREHE